MKGAQRITGSLRGAVLVILLTAEATDAAAQARTLPGGTQQHRRGSAWFVLDPVAAIGSPGAVSRDDNEEPPASGAGASVAAGSTAASAILAEMHARGHATLEDCFRLARILNERIGRTLEDLEQSEQARKFAISGILPEITFEDTYYRQNRVDLGGTDQGTTVSISQSRNEALVRLRQPIFRGLRERAFIRSSSESIEASRLAVDDEERRLYGDVAGAYYAVLLSEAAVGTLRDTVDVERERVREIGARLEVGLARRTEVLLARSQLEEDEARLTRAINASLVTRERLAFLTGTRVELPLRDDTGAQDLEPQEGSSERVLPEDPEAPPAPSESGAAMDETQRAELDRLVEIGLANRRDLARLERVVASARWQVSVARGEYLPEIDLDAIYLIDRWNYSSFASETDWAATIGLTFPIFTGGRIRANVAAAESRLRQTELDRDELARAIELEVRDRWLSLQSDLAQFRTQTARVQSADENYRLVREEYRSGLATNLEVIAAQNQLLSARLDTDSQRYQVLLDQVALLVAQGLLPADAGQIEKDSQTGSPGTSVRD